MELACVGVLQPTDASQWLRGGRSVGALHGALARNSSLLVRLVERAGTTRRVPCGPRGLDLEAETGAREGRRVEPQQLRVSCAPRLLRELLQRIAAKIRSESAGGTTGRMATMAGY